VPSPTVPRAEISHIEIRFEKPLGGSGVRGVDLVVADLTDSDGAEGLGFTYVIGGNGGLTARAAAEHAERFIRDQPLRHPVAAWREIVKSFNRTGDGPNMVALAALDVALWDLTAKRQGVPLGVAMGGADRATPVYGSGGFSPGMDPAAAAEMAQQHLAQGFRGVKPRVNAQGPDAALMQRVRGAIPDTVGFMVDAK
jgi:L-alanine-DL-glutamate epimerase-like enolase superfamily enzyme